MLTIVPAREYSQHLPTDSYRLLVVTHDGRFHADEVFAIALLYLYYRAINVVRTSSPAVLQQAVAHRQVYVINAGGVYNPAARCFDRHHAEAPAVVEQLFVHLFPDYRQHARLHRVYTRFIRELAGWNKSEVHRLSGDQPLLLLQIIMGYNRLDSSEQNHQFIKAVQLARQILANELYAAALYEDGGRIKSEIFNR